MNKYLKSKKGITLIALVVTIIVLLILAVVAINLTMGENGLFNRAQQSAFKYKMATIAEECELYFASYQLSKPDVVDAHKEIYAGEVLKAIIADEEIEVEESKVQNIRELIKSVGSTEEKYVIVFEGELYYVSQPSIPNNDNQVKWCQDIGIKIWEYVGSDGIYNQNGDYEKVNDIYICTPKINTGFVKEYTRYVYERNGNLVPGTWINKKPEADWYDYKNQKWANLYIEADGVDSYYVWIPRYVYKLDNDNERSDVKFVDLNNNYKDAKTDAVTTWEQLQAEGYKVPEAFYWGDNEDYMQNEPIPGYWMSKYQLSEFNPLEDGYIVDYILAPSTSSISVQNIEVNTTKTIGKYVFSINGNIISETTSNDVYSFSNLTPGEKRINVTVLDNNGEIIGSMTKYHKISQPNPPDLTGFNKDSTFYVYWDENGVEYNETPISKEPPAEWYDYDNKKWANIVTISENTASYFVWIPRYEYKLDETQQRSIISFVAGTSTKESSGYKIPEAFYWGDNEDYKQNTPITGYWMSKYQISEHTDIETDVDATPNSIIFRDIIGTGIRDGLKYQYYLNGNKVYEGTSATEKYEFENLKPNTSYNVRVTIKDSTTNAYVCTISRTISTTDANKPELTGFNANQTYYVLYDNEGNETIGSKIQNNGGNMPNNWYNYTQRKWANIVVTDGTVSNGKITGGTYKNYFVWIPRYEYKLDTRTERAQVRFISGTGSETSPGYQIPEAFYWGDDGENYKNNTPLTGYWMSKYQLSN